MARKSSSSNTKVATLTHSEASRRNIPTAEFESIVEAKSKLPIRLAMERRNRDLDPQIVWRGKDEQDASPLTVSAPPLYIQEKIHPKALLDDLLHRSLERAHDSGAIMDDLFLDFNGVADGADKTEFYHHEQHWSNRMILGDSLQVMASLVEREGMRGKIQSIFIDPPYGIRFNSNFQWSTTSRDVKDGDVKHITRDPEQVKAFRDTWRDGIHSYLTYLRDRLTIARELLSKSGSVFVQIGDENVHRVQALLCEIFGEDNAVSLISFRKTTSSTTDRLAGVADYVVWFARDKAAMKYRQLYRTKSAGGDGAEQYGNILFNDGRRRTATAEEKSGSVPLPDASSLFRLDQLQSAANSREKGDGAACWFKVECEGRVFTPTMQSTWKTNEEGMLRLGYADRLVPQKSALAYLRRIEDFPAYAIHNLWLDVGGATGKRYIVETTPRIIERCILMSTDPGDLVLDPTCGSGTTAHVAEHWGRRWITVDTSRVALALARARIMGARYPYYILSDSLQGQQKEAEVTRTVPSLRPTNNDLRRGFVYERVPHVTLGSIAHNALIDVIWNKWQETLEPLRASLNREVNEAWKEWEVPREAAPAWPAAAEALHSDWWRARMRRQAEIDASIAATAEFETLYDKPYRAKKTVRVAGPFTFESLSPHRYVGVGANDELLDPANDSAINATDGGSYVGLMLDNLKTSGVQQARKTDKLTFSSLVAWPGDYICADGRYRENEGERTSERRAAIFIGPEFGTVLKADLTAAAREAADAGFDVLIACAFAYEAYASEVVKLGKMPILKARMNADLHMAEDLKRTEKANLFVIFGEPDIELTEHVEGKIAVTINGVDVFHPGTGEVRSDGPDGIACWFIDTDYNEESFFVRHAYFLGANDPYDALKKTLKAEIDEAAWRSLHSAISRPFPKPKSGRIAVKVINHLGDEVMKVFRVA